MKQVYLMLGHTYKPGKVSPAGWYVSEKLDGVRAFWDGGVSRGMAAGQVPYSNTVKDVNPQKATGLWSRTGKVIHAPDWWLNHLPHFPLDGELFLGRGRFQETYSRVAKYTSGDWKGVAYKIFDSPPYSVFTKPRTIKVRDYEFSVTGGLDYNLRSAQEHWTFELVWHWLQMNVRENDVVQLTKQIRLPFHHFDAVKGINHLLDSIIVKGGEGVILRKPVSFWVSERSHFLLKHKPYLDAEGMVIGYKMGEGKFEGMMGSLILKSKNGKIFKISGFLDSERVMKNVRCPEPGHETYTLIDGYNPLFPIGTIVTYKYRELSDDGIPKEPRYFRRAK